MKKYQNNEGEKKMYTSFDTEKWGILFCFVYKLLVFDQKRLNIERGSKSLNKSMAIMFVTGLDSSRAG